MTLTVALALVALSFGLFVPVFSDYLRTGEVERFPTLIVCGFMVIAAIQSLFTGLILKNIVQKNRQDFEMRLLEVRRSSPGCGRQSASGGNEPLSGRE